MASVLQAGQSLPDVKVIHPDGTRTSLALMAGERGLAVFFMRARGCPVCLRHARRLAGAAGSLAARGVQATVVVPGDADEARSVAAALPGVAVVAGGGSAGHRSIGLDRLLLQQSGTLLIDASGIVRYVRAAFLPTSSFSLTALLEAAALLGDR